MLQNLKHDISRSETFLSELYIIIENLKIDLGPLLHPPAASIVVMLNIQGSLIMLIEALDWYLIN